MVLACFCVIHVECGMLSCEWTREVYQGKMPTCGEGLKVDTTLVGRQVEGVRVDIALDWLKWRGYEWTPPQVPLSYSVVSEVYVDSQG